MIYTAEWDWDLIYIDDKRVVSEGWGGWWAWMDCDGCGCTVWDGDWGQG